MWMTVEEAALQLRDAIDNQVKEMIMAKAVTRAFDKELLLEILDEDHDDYEILENILEDTSRWSIQYGLVFKELSSGKIYSVGYQVGATESQDESPWEHDGPLIDCYEVEPVEVKTIHFKPVLVK